MNYIIQSVIVSIMMIVMIGFGFLSLSIGNKFWYFFNNLFVGMIIYFLCLSYFYKQKLKELETK